MYSFVSRVRYSEITEKRELSLISIINYLQDCCTYESEDGGVGLDWLEEHHTAWMLTGWHIKIPKRPIYGQEIKITTWACGFRRFIGYRNFLITDVNTGEELVYAFSEWAYVNTLLQRPEKAIPEKEIEVYDFGEPLDIEFEKGKIPIPEEMLAVDDIVVTERNLDTNHHVNNAEYMAFALNVLPRGTDGRVTEFRAEYKMQSKLGDVIKPFVYDNEESGKMTVVLRDETGKNKLIAELKVSETERESN